MKRTSDYFIDSGRDNDGPQDSEADHFRYEAARITEWAARLGNHPDAQPGLERALLTVAELPIPQERNESQYEFPLP